MSRITDLLEAILNDEELDFEPKTKAQAYLKACCNRCGCAGLPTPTSKMGALLYLLTEKMAEGGDVSVEELDVTENGTYTAPSGKAYSPVNVNVSSGSDIKVFSGIHTQEADTTRPVYIPTEGYRPFAAMVMPAGGITSDRNGKIISWMGCAAEEIGQRGLMAYQKRVTELKDEYGFETDARSVVSYMDGALCVIASSMYGGQMRAGDYAYFIVAKPI